MNMGTEILDEISVEDVAYSGLDDFRTKKHPLENSKWCSCSSSSCSVVETVVGKTVWSIPSESQPWPTTVCALLN